MVKVSPGNPNPRTAKADVLAVTVREGTRRVAGLSGTTAKALSSLLTKASFEGKEGKVLAVTAPRGMAADRVLFVGLGRTADRNVLEATRRAAGTASRKASEHGARSVAFVPPDDSPEAAAAAAEGARLADYSFDRYKSGTGAKDAPKGRDLRFTVLASAAARRHLRAALPRIEAIVAGVHLARDLGNEPSNHLNPEALAEAARTVVKGRSREGLSCKVLGLQEIRDLEMGAFLAVNQGSKDEPRFIHLVYRPKRGRRSATAAEPRRVAVVGKGLTFDSGGISLKPAASMEDMKMDMCGSAAVLGLFRCLPELGIDAEVHGFIAATDNMPSGSAIKPGDIIRSQSGRTIEVINTDAEGRLTLVDAINQALKTEPDVVVDLATLTGACAVALGSATGVMSNTTALREALCKSADATGERSWPLPLFADYRSQIQSEFADVKNVGERYGGALTAGLFIQEWIPKGLPWAHMDIAGSAWTHAEEACCPKGATGTGVRTLAHWLRSLGT